MLQAILLGIVAFIAQSEYALGTSLLSRPIVTGLFTGIVLGDVSTGIIMGATLELAFIVYSARCRNWWDSWYSLCNYSRSGNGDGFIVRTPDRNIDTYLEKCLLGTAHSYDEPKSRFVRGRW